MNDKELDTLIVGITNELLGYVYSLNRLRDVSTSEIVLSYDEKLIRAKELTGDIENAVIAASMQLENNGTAPREG